MNLFYSTVTNYINITYHIEIDLKYSTYPSPNQIKSLKLRFTFLFFDCLNLLLIQNIGYTKLLNRLRLKSTKFIVH